MHTKCLLQSHNRENCWTEGPHNRGSIVLTSHCFNAVVQTDMSPREM